MRHSRGGKMCCNLMISRSRFEALPGVTLYDNAMSPCARRVRMTLMEKGIPFHKVSPLTASVT